MGFTNPYPASRLTLDATASINSGLVAFYPLTDETSSTALDISGNYHNGTMTNGAYFTGSTGIGRCAFFDGSNDYCTTGNAALSIDGSVGTISFWFKSNASQTGARLFEFGSSSSTGRSIGVLITSSGDVTFRYRQSSTNYNATGPALSSLGSGWNFAVATWDASNNINLYINGTKYSSTRSGSINVGNLDRGYIAERALEVPLGEAFQGEMQNVRCWTVELSQAQVDLLYARPWEGTNYGDLWPYSPPAAGSMTVDSSNSLVNGLLLWAPLTEGTGTTADCIVHAGHTGTQSGGVSWASTGIGTAASFDGVDDRFDFGTFSNYDAYTNATTVSMWCYLKSNSIRQYFLNKHDSSNSATRFYAWINASGVFELHLVDLSAGSGVRVAHSNLVNNILNRWVHLAFVSSGPDFTLASNLSVYVDGVMQTPSSSNNGDGFSSGEESSGIFTLGGRYWDNNRNMEADFQNVRVYNRALSATEVATLYHRPWEGIEYGDTFHYDPPAPASMLPLTSDAINTDQVGWWPLTETDDYASGAADISGSGNNGTQSGGVLSEVSRLGGVASFDGVNDYFDLGDNYDFGDGTTDSAFSISGWIYFDSLPAANKTHVVLSKTSESSSTTSVSSYLLGVASSGELAFRLYDESGGNQIRALSAASSFSTGQWYHVTGTYTGSGSQAGLQIYINGVNAVDSQSVAGTYVAMHNSTETAKIGCTFLNNPTYESFNDGNISNIRIWSRALTADEVWSIYENPWLGSNYKLAAGSSSTPLYNYIFRTERFRRLG